MNKNFISQPSKTKSFGILKECQLCKKHYIYLIRILLLEELTLSVDSLLFVERQLKDGGKLSK